MTSLHYSSFNIPLIKRPRNSDRMCTCSWPLASLCTCAHVTGVWGWLGTTWFLFLCYFRLCSISPLFKMSRKRPSSSVISITPKTAWKVYLLLLDNFRYFEKNKSRLMTSPCYLCIPPHLLKARILEPEKTAITIPHKHVYDMTPESQSSEVRVVQLLGNGSVIIFPQQWIHMQQYKNCWTCHFLCIPHHIKGKHTIISSQSFLFMLAIT
jgi:hypothetical protein